MRNFNKPEKLTDKDKALLRYVDNVKKNDPATMKMIAEYNPNEPVYNSVIGKFEMNGKSGPLSDFVKPGDKLPRVDFGLGKPQLFQDTLKNVQRRGKRANKMNDIDLIFSAADPKEKMEMRKNYKSYDFTKRKFKADIVKEEILKTPITKPAPAPLKPVEVPRIDVGELIKRRADDRAAREKANIIREFGDKGLGLLRLKFEGLDD